MSLGNTILQGLQQLNTRAQLCKNAIEGGIKYEQEIQQWCHNHYKQNECKTNQHMSSELQFNFIGSSVSDPISCHTGQFSVREIKNIPRNKISVGEAIQKFGVPKKWIKRLKYKNKKIKYIHRNNNLIKLNNEWYISISLIQNYLISL